MSGYTTKTAKLKTVITKAVITETNKAIIGENTNINKDGITTNNIIADNIKTPSNDLYLTKTVADGLYSGTASLYEWTPALDLKIQFSLLEGESYTVPSNGWFVINEKEISDGTIWTVSINLRPMFHSDNNGQLHVQILVKIGDVITSNSTINRSGYFMPCLSELRDWRVEELKSEADIWKDAVIYNTDGTITVQDQWLINTYNNTWGGVYGGEGMSPGSTDPNREFLRKLHTIKDDEAFDAEGNHLFYIQSENIKEGKYLFYNTSLESFTSDLSSLTNGFNMFSYCRSLESFTSDLSSLADGHYMFATTPLLTSFTSDLSSLTKGTWMFCLTSLTSFTSDLSSLADGDYMFFRTSSLTSFTSDLSSLTNGSSMFSYTSLASFTSDLPALTNGSCMFNYCTSLTSFTPDLSALTNGYYMFYFTSLESFTSDLSALTNGDHMFTRTSLESFTSDLSALTDGHYMFAYSSSLASFTSDLSALTDGHYMFHLTSLTSFTSDLSALTDGSYMFGYTPLTSFTSDLSSITNGSRMFHYCTSLESFTSDLSSLTNGSWMFSNASSLTSFTSDLSSLTNGDDMFYRCKLDLASVRRILIGKNMDNNDIIGDKSGKLVCIPTYTDGSSHKLILYLGTEEASLEFYTITGLLVVSSSSRTVSYKGWTISVKANY